MVTTGPFADAHERVTAKWEELAARYHEIGLDRVPSEWLSACRGRETEFSCYLGLTSAGPVASVPEGMVSITLRPHEYAAGSFKGSQEELMEVYTDLDRWIIAQGRERNYTVLWLESYPAPYQPSQPALKREIRPPLRPENPSRA